MDKKYELMPKETNGLHRIRALRSFGDVMEGDIGGFVEGEHNLSQDGLCWVYENTRVCGNAMVYMNARVFGNARVYENAQVYGDVQVYGHAQVYGDAWVSGNAQVSGDTQVSGNAQVYGHAQVYENALVFGYARVYGDARVRGHTTLDRPSKIVTNILGSKFPVTILDDVVHIGCIYLTTEEWIERYREIGEKEGFTLKQIDEYAIYIRMAEALQKLR